MLITQHSGREDWIGLEAAVHSPEVEQEGIDARSFFDRSPTFNLCDVLAVVGHNLNVLCINIKFLFCLTAFSSNGMSHINIH